MATYRSEVFVVTLPPAPKKPDFIPASTPASNGMMPPAANPLALGRDNLNSAAALEKGHRALRLLAQRGGDGLVHGSMKTVEGELVKLLGCKGKPEKAAIILRRLIDAGHYVPNRSRYPKSPVSEDLGRPIAKAKPPTATQKRGAKRTSAVVPSDESGKTIELDDSLGAQSLEQRFTSIIRDLENRVRTLERENAQLKRLTRLSKEGMALLTRYERQGRVPLQL
jgi:hypothetical protein